MVKCQSTTLAKNMVMRVFLWRVSQTNIFNIMIQGKSDHSNTVFSYVYIWIYINEKGYEKGIYHFIIWYYYTKWIWKNGRNLILKHLIPSSIHSVVWWERRIPSRSFWELIITEELWIYLFASINFSLYTIENENLSKLGRILVWNQKKGAIISANGKRTIQNNWWPNELMIIYLENSFFPGIISFLLKICNKRVKKREINI